MIFYTANDGGHTKLAGTQADARAINKNFEQIDIPTDKAGLMAFVQKLYDDIYDLEFQILEGGEGLPVFDDTDSTPPVPIATTGGHQPATSDAGPPPTGGPVPQNFTDADLLPEEDPDLFDARTLEEQVDALGMLGISALDQFDGWMEITGISPAFARGVALLNILAADDHSIARVFLRDRLKKRRKFGS